MNTRHKLIERKDVNKALFECPEGHRFVTTILTPKQVKLSQGKIQGPCDLLFSWWSKNGVSMECPKCKGSDNGN